MNISTATKLGATVREARLGSGLTQQQLATVAGVSRKFIIELEAGHQRAELGKALQALEVLGLGFFTEPNPTQTKLQKHIDTEMPFITKEILDGDYDFAMRLAIDMFTKARELLGGRKPPFLRRPDSTGDPRMDTLILAALRWALGAKPASVSPWPAPTPLKSSWYAYEFQGMTDAFRGLITRDTPSELSLANVYIRERSLTSA